jgi:hypothetical protein
MTMLYPAAGGSRGKEKLPSFDVVVACSMESVGFASVTFAPGTAAPLESTTEPRIAPVEELTCANNADDKTKKPSIDKTQCLMRKGNMVRLSLYRRG